MLTVNRSTTTLLQRLIRCRLQPQEFCRRWLGTTEVDEQERGCRARYIRLLSQVTGAETKTIDSNWGKGCRFEQMPQHYQATLAYADLLRQLLSRSASTPQGRRGDA